MRLFFSAMTVILGVLLSMPSSAHSQPEGITYYVAQNEGGASDENSGLAPTMQTDRDGPWLTIQYAANHLSPGDTLFIREGVYAEVAIVFARSGTEDRPITISNYEGELVIIDGSISEEYLPGIAIFSGQRYFIFDGLTIRNMPWSGFITDDLAEEPIRGLTLRNIVAYNNGWNGIELNGVHSFLIENVESYSNGYYGIAINGSNENQWSSANGEIRHALTYDHQGERGHGIAINQGNNIVIRDSVAHNNTIHGFDVSDWPKGSPASHHVVLERNLSYENGDMGFAINSDSHHVTFRQNIAWHNTHGFACYEGCWQVEYLNNVAVENSSTGFWIDGEPGTYVDAVDDRLLVFHNNITYNNGSPVWEERPALVIEEDGWELEATYNDWGGGDQNSGDGDALVVGLIQNGGEVIYRSSDINHGYFQIGNISVDPLLDDDFKLLPNSPAIDAGVDVGLPFVGTAPDMGAFEFEPDTK